MFRIISFILLFASLFGGFILAHGTMKLLWHPYELLMIFGPTLSCFCIANPLAVVKETGKQLIGLFKKKYTDEFYKNSLLLMFELMKLYKEKGSVDLENHLENPKESAIFVKYPSILDDTRSVNFIAENLRLVTNGKFSPHDIDAYVDSEIDSYIAEMSQCSDALDQLCDALPSLGIVAAVLGIIITMQHINGTAYELGQHISSALFGTFAGVFSAYGVVSPLSKAIASNTEKQRHYFEVLKSFILSVVHGYSPYIALEIARKNIPPALRMSQVDIEKSLRGEVVETVAQ